MNIDELEKDIKKELRASMNGILSARMREVGMPFRLIFGTELPRLRLISEDFPKDEALAWQLWSRSIRETRLLAILLMPSSFSASDADRLISGMLTAEEAQVASMDLLTKTDGIVERIPEWAQRTEGWYQTCAFLTLSHLLSGDVTLAPVAEARIREAAEKALPGARLPLRKAILVALDRLQDKKDGQNDGISK